MRGRRSGAKAWLSGICLCALLLYSAVSSSFYDISAAPQPSVTEVFIDPSIPPDMANAIRQTISATVEYARTSLGRTRTRPFRSFFLPNAESVYRKWGEVYGSIDAGRREFGNNVARVYLGQDLWMRMDDEGIVRRQAGRLEKIVGHEVFHLVQSELENSSNPLGPTWLREGAAEFIGYRVADAMTVLPWQTARQQLISNVSARGLLTMPTILQVAEEGQGFASLNQKWGVLYQYVALAVEFLTGNDLPSIRRYHLGLGEGLTWRESFRRAFGEGPETFYERWRAYAPTIQR